MKIQFILLTGLIFNTYSLFAQNARFTNSGVIEFEKSTNQHALMKKNFGSSTDARFGSMFEDMKKNTPQFKISKSTLKFSGNKSLFTPVAETEGHMFDTGAGQINTIYTDLNSSISTTEKKLFEETFLVKDSTRKINWKLTNEVRTIAGYECRRANAIIMDSVYVVAFYTDKIPVSGGPESFTGLPGMILGVALPHDHITWFAKTVTDKSVPENEIRPPVKGKPVDNKGLMETINKLVSKWGGRENQMNSFVRPLVL
ncbi:GLPGLI family protein [Pedobacter africanus]|uniref:GLPGLI family protein n=1 Tax=Pedobacter africanus TaxID=151894 RepID=A0ACC6L3B7_9SPHI|nr:GLPGLI family protein [Pedobacter africanus]MDR6785915.1 GLPGLI family protein [Pedobacter africanus]